MSEVSSRLLLTKHIDKMDFDDIIRKKFSKECKKLEKMKEQQDKLNAYASMNTKEHSERSKYFFQGR